MRSNKKQTCWIFIIFLTFAVILIMYQFCGGNLIYQYVISPVQSSGNSNKLFPRTVDGVTKCNSFMFDHKEWTLHQLTPSLLKGDSNKCRQVYEDLFKAKKVKKLVHLNGTIENTGCNRHTPRCTERPYFDRKLNVRINYPPCCRQHALDVFKVVTNELDVVNVSQVLVYGALLGLVRNGKLPPYDGDIDMLVDENFWKTSKMNVFLRNLTSKYGLETSWRDGGNKLWINLSKNNSNGLDVWAMRKKGNFIYVSYGGNIPQKYDTMLPLKKAALNGIPAYIPNNPDVFLDVHYGKNWRPELNCTAVRDGKCVPSNSVSIDNLFSLSILSITLLSLLDP